MKAQTTYTHLLALIYAAMILQTRLPEGAERLATGEIAYSCITCGARVRKPHSSCYDCGC